MFWSNGIAELHQADARAIPLPDASVHCVITSPPYWGLRDYGLGEWAGGNPDCEHVVPAEPNTRPTAGVDRGGDLNGDWRKTWPGGICGKCGARQQAVGVGLEPTLGEWLANIVAVGREVWRVLRDDGSFFLNLGDAYAGGGRGGGTGKDKQQTNVGSTILGPEKGSSLPAKNLMGQPWRAAFALQDDGWYLRSAIVWHKPNPMPESVSDRPTNAYEMVFLLTKNARYYYDAEVVREPQSDATFARAKGGLYQSRSSPKDANRIAGDDRGNAGFKDAMPYAEVPGGRNARNVWTIPTQGRPEAHFATFPDELPRRCILAGTSEYGVCADCGAPWDRVVEKGELQADDGKKKLRPVLTERSLSADANNAGSEHAKTGHVSNAHYQTQTLGWQPTCNCGADRDCPIHGKPKKQDGHGPRHAGFNARWKENGGIATPRSTGWHPGCTCGAERVPATVLDPFVGSGTTVAVAQQLGRRGIGLDLNSEYLAIAQKRLEGIPLPIPTEAYECQTLTTESPSLQASLWT